MLESTVNASDILGGIGTGALTKSTTRTRRRQTGEISTGIQSTAGTHSVSTRTATGTMVETLSDAALVEHVLSGDAEVFANTR